MIQFSADPAGFAAICMGLAAVIGSVATLIWACRRDPRGPSGPDSSPRLPPAE